MKTILYMGISANGYIAKEDGNSEFTSEEDLKGFYENSKNAGNIIMGKNTYLEASRQGYFPFPDAFSDFELELELLEVKNLNKNTVQLHYEVLK